MISGYRNSTEPVSASFPFIIPTFLFAFFMISNSFPRVYLTGTGTWFDPTPQAILLKRFLIFPQRIRLDRPVAVHFNQFEATQIVFESGLKRIPLHIFDSDQDYSLPPQLLVLLAAAIDRPNIIRGHESAQILREQASHLVNGGALENSPLALISHLTMDWPWRRLYHPDGVGFFQM
ncbi:hypothetical protein [Austwickia sp. TVS 96-490-7B]|uniref:hypothetical protein n=1 Tax=Austwickia sp. TVS 96-490-7B TaxID=2830843 RepID=UPI001C561EFC|nr:hypothetical protein [Austwickia sp. TVS 96-490-7B]